MPLYLRSQPHTPNHMEDTLWSEIADAPGEIFDIDIDEEELEQSFESKLNSNIDF